MFIDNHGRSTVLLSLMSAFKLFGTIICIGLVNSNWFIKGIIYYSVSFYAVGKGKGSEAAGWVWWVARPYAKPEKESGEKIGWAWGIVRPQAELSGVWHA